MIHARAPGKIILMGEHAALHGCPAIACAVGLYCNVWLSPHEHRQIDVQLPDLSFRHSYAPEQLADYVSHVRLAWEHYRRVPSAWSYAQLHASAPDHLINCAIGEILLRLAPPDWQGFNLRVQSQIPTGAGFGSSGALAVTLMAALSQLFRLTETDCPLEQLALSVERFQHGEPSGIDHNTSLLGSVVEGRRDAKGQFNLRTLPGSPPLLPLANLRLFNTGTARENTGQVIAATRYRLEGAHNPLLASMQRNTERFCSLLQQSRPMPETLRAVIRDYQADLEKLGVVPAAVARLIRSIENAGGAAKICGAGALTGHQAGALLVMGAEDVTELSRYRRIDAPLAVAGLEIRRS